MPQSAVTPFAMRLSHPSPRFLLFLVCGALNTAFGYAAFLLLLWLGLPVATALVISTLTGILFNFQTSCRVVFASKEKSALARFVLVYVTLFAVNYGAVLALKHVGLQNWSAQAIAVMPMALLSFVAQRNLVFRDRCPPR